jgi:glutamate synthase (NADPH/NADH) large chain
MYDPSNEHDACGVGLLVNIHGAKSHEIVDKGLKVLENMVHRGAESADNKTGDGAGILVQIPHEFILLQGIALPEKGTYGTGLIFLPKDAEKAELALKIISDLISKESFQLLTIRDVPVNSDILGSISRSNEPTIKQLFLSDGSRNDELERHLYILRKKIEQAFIKIKQDASHPLSSERNLSIVILTQKNVLCFIEIVKYCFKKNLKLRFN